MKCDLEGLVFLGFCAFVVFLWISRERIIRYVWRWRLPIIFGITVLLFFSMATTPKEVGSIFFGFVLPIALLFAAVRIAWKELKDESTRRLP